MSQKRLVLCVSWHFLCSHISSLSGGGIQASLACTDPLVGWYTDTVWAQLSCTVSTKTGRLGWLKKIRKNVMLKRKVSMQRGTYKSQGSRMVARKTNHKTALVCFCVWPLALVGLRVSRRTRKAAPWRNPPVGFDQPDPLVKTTYRHLS